MCDSFFRYTLYLFVRQHIYIKFLAKLRFNFLIIFIEENETIIAMYIIVLVMKSLSFPLASEHGLGFKINIILRRIIKPHCEFILSYLVKITIILLIIFKGRKRQRFETYRTD